MAIIPNAVTSVAKKSFDSFVAVYKCRILQKECGLFEIMTKQDVEKSFYAAIVYLHEKGMMTLAQTDNSLRLFRCADILLGQNENQMAS